MPNPLSHPGTPNNISSLQSSDIFRKKPGLQTGGSSSLGAVHPTGEGRNLLGWMKGTLAGNVSWTLDCCYAESVGAGAVLCAL